jgi:hypothetical protein
MPRKTTKTIRLGPEDTRALKRAEADGVSLSELVRRGRRIVAAPHYACRRRSPRTRLFVCTEPQLGEESGLFQGRLGTRPSTATRLLVSSRTGGRLSTLDVTPPYSPGSSSGGSPDRRAGH